MQTAWQAHNYVHQYKVETILAIIVCSIEYANHSLLELNQ